MAKRPSTSSEPEALSIDLGIGGWRVPVHSHIVYISETERDLAEAVGFVETGLRGSDHCVVIGGEGDIGRILAILEARDLDLEELQAQGRLTVLKRVPTARGMLDCISSVFERLFAGGASFVRLFGIVGWGREEGPADAELLSVEAHLTEMAERFPCVILCLHEIHSLTGLISRYGVLGVHPKVLAEGGALGSPFFAPRKDRQTHLAAVASELSKQQGARQTLRRQTEILQAVFDNIPVMISFYDAAGRLLLVNREWERTMGWSLDEARRTDFLSAAYPDPERHREVLEFMQNAKGRWMDFQTRTRQGKVIDTSWLRRELSDGTQIGFGLDLTERKWAEEQVRESQQLLQLVLATLPVGVAVTDRGGDIVLTNAAAKRIWGDMIVSGRERWVQSKGFWHDSGMRIGPTEWASVRSLSDGETSLNELIDIETFNGQRKTIQNSSAPIRNAEGRIVGAVIVNEDVTERTRAETALRESAIRLQYLSRRLLTVQEEERRHLSRELHDEFGQLLATITVHLHAARSLAGEAARSRLDECAALLQRAGAQMRSLALELRPTMLETAGLDATLRWLAEEHQQRTGIATRVVGHLGDVPGDLAIAGFRVVQEALTNVVRHARAHQVWIELSQTESALELVIRDDGDGFDATRTLEEAARRGRLGLLGMRERVQILGGSLDVESESGNGTRIRVSLPLTEAAATPGKPVS